MCLRAVVLRREHASESPGRLVTVTGYWAPPTRFLTQEFWVGPLVWGPLLEDHVLRVVSGGTPGDEENTYQQEVLPNQGPCALRLTVCATDATDHEAARHPQKPSS